MAPRLKRKNGGRSETPGNRRAAVKTIKQKVARENMADLERKFVAGEAIAMLKAIRVCANCDLPLPAWAASAYISRFDRVHSAQAGSWDEVFGRPVPKGTHLKKLRERRALGLAVLERVEQLRNSTDLPPPIDDALFEFVGRAFRISKSHCNELYYLQKRLNRVLEATLPPTLKSMIEAISDGRDPLLPPKS